MTHVSPGVSAYSLHSSKTFPKTTHFEIVSHCAVQRGSIYAWNSTQSVPCYEFGLDIFMPNICSATFMSSLYMELNRAKMAHAQLFQGFSNFLLPRNAKYDNSLARNFPWTGNATIGLVLETPGLSDYYSLQSLQVCQFL